MRYFEIATQLSRFFFAQDLRLVTHLTPPAPPARCVCLIFRFFAIGTGFCMHVRPLPNVELPRRPCATGKQRASQRGSPTRSARQSRRHRRSAPRLPSACGQSESCDHPRPIVEFGPIAQCRPSFRVLRRPDQSKASVEARIPFCTKCQTPLVPCDLFAGGDAGAS